MCQNQTHKRLFKCFVVTYCLTRDQYRRYYGNLTNICLWCDSRMGAVRVCALIVLLDQYIHVVRGGPFVSVDEGGGVYVITDTKSIFVNIYLFKIHVYKYSGHSGH